MGAALSALAGDVFGDDADWAGDRMAHAKSAANKQCVRKRRANVGPLAMETAARTIPSPSPNGKRKMVNLDAGTGRLPATRKYSFAQYRYLSPNFPGNGVFGNNPETRAKLVNVFASSICAKLPMCVSSEDRSGNVHCPVGNS